LKTSWWPGIFMIWAFLLLMGSVVEGSNLFTADRIAEVQSLLQPEIAEVSNLASVPVIGDAYVIVTKVLSYIVVIGQVLFLWFPSLWSGSWYMFYLFVIFPLSAAMWIGLVFVLRGVSSQ